MSGPIGAYVAQVDRVLGAGESLFAASGAAARIDERLAPSPHGSPGRGGLDTGVHAAGQQYRGRWSAMSALDGRALAAASEGTAEAERGRVGASRVRHTARGQAAAIAPATRSPAGVKLMVSTMEERLGAMEKEVATAKAQNRLLAERLRQLVIAYRAAGPTAGSAMPNADGLVTGSGRGRGNLPTFGAWTPAAAARIVRAATVSPGQREQPAAVKGGAAGRAEAAIPLSRVSFQGRAVWPGGTVAIRGYLDEALDRMGIRDPKARANWLPGMLTIADHESSFRTDAINLTDSNAWGPRQVDGGPLHSTRGPWQVMPDTFARYHQPGTSNSIWDPVATACASINYQMDRYGVSFDGHNQRALVGQANPGIRRGY